MVACYRRSPRHGNRDAPLVPCLVSHSLSVSCFFVPVTDIPPLPGVHHVSAITGQAPANVRFYTQVLGLRLVTKTVNQDDPSSYHLFYGDETGSPGTDLTFFDVPRARELRPGPGLITGTALRVRGPEALAAWADRLDAHDVSRTPIHRRAGRRALTLFDEEGQTIHLVDDDDDTDRVPDTTPWTDGPVPAAMALQGLGPVEITVSDLAPTREALTSVFGFREARTHEVETDGAVDDGLEPVSQPGGDAVVFETGAGGVAAEVHVIERPDADPGWLGGAACTTLPSAPPTATQSAGGASGSTEPGSIPRPSSTGTTSSRSTPGSRAAFSSRSPRTPARPSPSRRPPLEPSRCRRNWSPGARRLRRDSNRSTERSRPAPTAPPSCPPMDAGRENARMHAAFRCGIVTLCLCVPGGAFCYLN